MNAKIIETWTEQDGDHFWRLERHSCGRLVATDIASPTGFSHVVREDGVNLYAGEKGLFTS